MFRFATLSLGFLFLIISGCGQSVEPLLVLEDDFKTVESTEVMLPVEDYFERATFKVFGQKVQDRFSGYHAGDDIEFTDVAAEIPVVAIADGTVLRIGWVSGYGGLLILEHEVQGREIRALYGHLDLDSSSLAVSDRVSMGQFLANLGEGESAETDGERKHLHFGLYEADELRLAGYVTNAAQLAQWINPSEFFISYGLQE